MIPAGALERRSVPNHARFGPEDADAQRAGARSALRSARRGSENARGRIADEQLEILTAGQREALGVLAPRLRERPSRFGNRNTIPARPAPARRRRGARRRSRVRRKGPSSRRRCGSRRESDLRRRAAAGRRKARSAPPPRVRRRCVSVLRVSSSPARAAPNAPVTASTSPGRPPARVFASEARTSPTTVIAIVNASARERSPPTIASFQRRRARGQAAVEFQNLVQSQCLAGTPSATVASTRTRTHRGQIARVCRHRAPAGVLERHRVARKMNAFDEHVGRDRAAMRARRLPKRRIVADTQLHLIRCAGPRGSTSARIAATTSSSVTREARECGAAPPPDPARRRPPSPSRARRRRPRRARARSPAPTPPSTSIRHAGLRRSIERACLANLFDRARDELLSREAGIDAHHEHGVAILDDVLQHLDRRLRTDRDSRPSRPCRADATSNRCACDVASK